MIKIVSTEQVNSGTVILIGSIYCRVTKVRNFSGFDLDREIELLIGTEKNYYSLIYDRHIGIFLPETLEEITVAELSCS